MGVYRFKVSFLDDEDINRTIDVVGVQNFEIFHKTILKSVKFDEGELASFYLNYQSPDQIEIALSDIQGEDFAMLMKDAKIQDLVSKETSKLTYVYDFMNMWTFDIELIEYFESSVPNTKYPNIVKSTGIAPDQSDKDLDADFGDDEVNLIKELMDSNKDMFDSNDFDDDNMDDDFDEYSDNDDSLY